MPIYVFRCKDCGTVQEELRDVGENNNKASCAFCGGNSERAHDQERVVVRPDIEPGFNESLGQNIGSRRELREALAFNDAHSKELMIGSNPSDGRLTKEERVELIDKQRGVLGRRDDSGWGNEGTDEDAVTVEGVADYDALRKSIKKNHDERRAGRHGS